MVDKTKEKANDTPNRYTKYEFPDVAAEILSQLYATKKDLSSLLVKEVTEVYKGKTDPILDYMVLASLDELAKGGLIVKEEEAGNDAIYSMTEEGNQFMEDMAKKHIELIMNLLKTKN